MESRMGGKMEGWREVDGGRKQYGKGDGARERWLEGQKEGRKEEGWVKRGWDGLALLTPLLVRPSGRGWRLWVPHGAQPRGECVARTQQIDNERNRDVLEVVLRARNGDQCVEPMAQAGMIIVTRPGAGAGAGAGEVRHWAAMTEAEVAEHSDWAHPGGDERGAAVEPRMDVLSVTAIRAPSRSRAGAQGRALDKNQVWGL